jgi:ribosomal protein L23
MLSNNLGDLLSGPLVDTATSESFFIMKLDAKTTLVKLLPVKSLINEAVTITAGKYKGQTGMMRGFTLSGKSAYVLLDWKGGAREEEEKCLRLTSLTLTNDVHGDRVNITTGKYKGLTGTMRGFTPSRKSAYVLLDGEGGARGEKEKCLRLTSLTLTNKETLVRETVPKHCNCGANGGSGYVHGDRVTVMVGKHKGQSGVVQGFTSSGKSAYVLLDGEREARGKEETCLRLTWLNDAHYQIGRHGVTTK